MNSAVSRDVFRSTFRLHVDIEVISCENSFWTLLIATFVLNVLSQEKLRQHKDERP